MRHDNMHNFRELFRSVLQSEKMQNTFVLQKSKASRFAEKQGFLVLKCTPRHVIINFVCVLCADLMRFCRTFCPREALPSVHVQKEVCLEKEEGLFAFIPAAVIFLQLYFILAG